MLEKVQLTYWRDSSFRSAETRNFIRNDRFVGSEEEERLGALRAPNLSSSFQKQLIVIPTAGRNLLITNSSINSTPIIL